jgi:glycosyltransferase involved in cell wall biosynthesis
MTAPVVSYVIAAYNHEKFIEELLQSIRAQTFREIEIVVVDDGSSDATAAIAQRLAETDCRITVHTQPNAGVVSARNAGIDRSTGEYISIVDSDEILPPDRTARMVHVLQRDPTVALVFGDVDIVREDEGIVSRFSEIYPVMPGDFSEALFSHYCFVPAGAVMFRRDIWQRTGPFWGPGPSSDYLKWIEIGLEGRVVALPQLLGTWRLHGDNVSQGRAASRVQQYHDLCAALAQLITKHPALDRRVGRARQQDRYSRCYVMAGFYAGREGDWKLARQQFAMALSQRRSFLNVGLWVSTLPLMNCISRSVYAWAARRFLPGLA